VGVAMTLAVIYLGGGLWIASRYGILSYIHLDVMALFLVFVVLGVFMYGSMFVAVGASVTNIKEAQSLMMPVMVVIVTPIFFIGPIFQNPSGLVAMAATFFPFSAPMITIARIAIPPGIPLWQVAGAATVSLLTTIALVWAAGRIFRVGILMQGQGAKLSEMLKWCFRG
jgi:ABC-2 type transport system permease protein